jgi:hypothetical protein
MHQVMRMLTLAVPRSILDTPDLRLVLTLLHEDVRDDSGWYTLDTLLAMLKGAADEGGMFQGYKIRRHKSMVPRDHIKSTSDALAYDTTQSNSRVRKGRAVAVAAARKLERG